MTIASRNLLLTKPPATAFAPTDIAGLKLWLAADRINGLSDGDPVGTWSDLSGQGNHATQATSSKRPTYKPGIQNGLPGVLFDGVDDGLNTASTVITAGDFSIFLVTRAQTSINDARLLLQGDVSHGAYMGLFTTAALLRCLINATAFGVASLSAGTMYMLDTQYRAAANPTTVLNVNSVQDSTQNLAADYRGTMISIGQNPTVTAFLHGYIFEALIFGPLSTIQTSQIRTYLTSRWGF